MIRPFFATIAAVLLVASAATASDPTMGQDEVTLKDGGTIRGTIVSSQPGVGVKIIELGSTEAQMIEWSRVGTVERGKYAPKSDAVPPGSAEGDHPAPAGSVGGVVAWRAWIRLHVDSPQPTTIYRHKVAEGAVNGYGVVADFESPVCTSPCDKLLDASSDKTYPYYYYTASGDFVPSGPFSLAGAKDDMELSVKPGSTWLRFGGTWLAFVGGVGVVAGAIFELAFASTPSELRDQQVGWMKPTGLVSLGGGAAMFVGGIIMILESRTHIELHPMGEGSQGTAKSTARAPRYWMGSTL
jgi:hypothetical protein